MFPFWKFGYLNLTVFLSFWFSKMFFSKTFLEFLLPKSFFWTKFSNFIFFLQHQRIIPAESCNMQKFLNMFS